MLLRAVGATSSEGFLVYLVYLGSWNLGLRRSESPVHLLVRTSSIELRHYSNDVNRRSLFEALCGNNR